jgi:hypothetical protein
LELELFGFLFLFIKSILGISENIGGGIVAERKDLIYFRDFF